MPHGRKTLLIDSNALIHRAYHALPQTMATREGMQTNAMYGFVAALLHALETIKPDMVYCCFDVAGDTFRHVEYEHYKAHRRAMDDGLAVQIPHIYELVHAFGIPIVTKEGYEADDLIGTLAKKLEKTSDIVILTGDKDELQLLSPHTSVMMQKNGKEAVLYSPELLHQEYGLTPQEFIVFKALRGDPSDNIPGVSGVGEVTALKLVQQYHTLDQLYKALQDNADNHPLLKGKLRDRLVEQQDIARLSERLATIDRDAPLADSIAAISFTPDHAALAQLFEQLEFRSFGARVAKIFGDTVPEVSLSKQHDVGIMLVPDFVRWLKGIKTGAVAIGTTYSEEIGEARHITGLAVSHQGVTKAARWDAELQALLQRVIRNAALTKIVWDVKLLAHLIDLAKIPDAVTDVMVLDLLLGNGRDGAAQVLHKREMTDSDLELAGQRTAVLLQSANQAQKAVTEAGMGPVWQDIEQPLTQVLFTMERTGVLIDVRFLTKVSDEMSGQIARLEQQIWHEAGQEFNIASPQQLSAILFDKLRLAVDGVKKKTTGRSTDAATLESLRGLHPIIDLVMQYREVTKLKGTYVDTLPQLVSQRDGRVHATFNQIGAATGRISSNDPNLQNIPIRTDAGNLIRRSFIAAPGNVLLSLDYSQFELRILAHLSGDAEMRRSFKEGQDIHTTTAAHIHNVGLDQVTKEMRRAAKTINFGILYGLSAHSLSKTLGIDFKSGQELIDRYFATYPKVKEYLKSVVEQSRKQGFYQTLFGRRRNFPELQSAVWAVRQAGERMAMNFPMQGTQADILKIAMIQTGDSIAHNRDVQLILSVHDELVFEVKRDQATYAAAEMRQIMVNAAHLDVPVEVSASVGPNWADMQEL